MPALGQGYVKSAQITDARRMALLAAEVMEYRKQHGKLPDDLTFLLKIPLSKLDHKPLMYEKTKIPKLTKNIGNTAIFPITVRQYGKILPM